MESLLEKILRFGRRVIPAPVFRSLQPFYHFLLAILAALFYRFPAKKIIVVGVTGTKGKTTVLEILNAVFERAGFKTAVLSTLRFKIGDKSERNLKKMTVPGRFFVQKFLRRAVDEKCEYVFMEITSQAVSQFRHKFLFLDAAIFTNLAPEHIESHGSFKNYRAAKMKIFDELFSSRKKNRISVVNSDDGSAEYFLKSNPGKILLFGLDASAAGKIAGKTGAEIFIPSFFKVLPDGLVFKVKDTEFRSPLLGEFNLLNILAAVSFALSRGVDLEIAKRAIEDFKDIPGRVEFIKEGQGFDVVVDYAHTPDSLKALYGVFKNKHIICVLGATGGGRDKWKRKEMGRVASDSCDKIFLTNEDPYDEEPENIVRDVSEGIEDKNKIKIIMDRREAIAAAFSCAKKGDAVLITGKGTDPWIMGKNGTKIKWDDRDAAREELKKLRDTNIRIHASDTNSPV